MKNKVVKNGLQAITVMFQFEDMGEQIEDRFEGFLTSADYAMFVEGDTLMIVPVKPTNEPLVYLAGDTLELGIVDDLSQSVLIIESVAKKLNNMTAYEFATKIMMNVRCAVNFENMIVPSTSSTHEIATLESGVA